VKNTVPGDLELRGSHGYIPAGPNKVWSDLVIATGMSPSYAVEAARIEGGAAQRAANVKHIKHDHTIPPNVHFVAAAFEADGFTSPLVLNLLRGSPRNEPTATTRTTAPRALGSVSSLRPSSTRMRDT